MSDFELMQKTDKKIIGRRELVDFPLLQLHQIEAKVDTGAYTSAIHCSYIAEVSLPDGSRVIRCRLLDPGHPAYDARVVEFRHYSLRQIKSSFGQVQDRYVIRTQIQLFEEVLEAEFSLSDRSDLKCPVLIGRALLQHHFLVDVAKKNVAHKQRTKANKKKKDQNI
jgi:hypothetical protein